MKKAVTLPEKCCANIKLYYAYIGPVVTCVPSMLIDSILPYLSRSVYTYEYKYSY